MIGDSVATLFKDNTRRQGDKCCKRKDQQDTRREASELRMRRETGRR
jgi:hypothetical protein